MPLEEIRASPADGMDEFPVGMRVLAVDDDPTCLMLLGGLLRKCQYQVTTTTQAKAALEMLRKDRKRFDLIISDVYMPDMDGFRLLELIGLEMDLPVIMLSANSDPKLVMKGINHGAVDYLVKPVRIEELRNIWQHVIRRKKLDPKKRNKHTSEEGIAHQENQEGKIRDEPIGNYRREKLSRKRKEEDDDEDEEEESEGNGTENDDPSSHKRPRVVWSADLHKKFVAAVNQLGMKNAVPKRILEIMNVEGISRENVASHLQKYRSYLKRVSSLANQQLQANMIAAYRQEGSSYVPMNPLTALGDFPIQSIPSGTILSPSLSAYNTSSVLARLNSPSGVSLQSLSPSSSSATVQVQPSHGVNSFNSSLPIASGNPPLFQGNQLQTQSGAVFGNQQFLEVPPSKPQPFMAGFNGSHHLGNDRYKDNWHSTLPPSNLLPQTTPLCEPFSHNQSNNPIHFPSTTTMSVPNHFYNSNQSVSNSSLMIPSGPGTGQLSPVLDQNSGAWGRITDSSLIGQSNINNCPLQQLSEIDKLLASDLQTRSSKDYSSEQLKPLGGFLYNGYDFSLDELLDATTKPALETMSMNPGFGFGAHSFGS